LAPIEKEGGPPNGVSTKVKRGRPKCKDSAQPLH